MEFRILGPLEVVSAGNALPLGGTKQRALLALLLVHRNEPVSVDRIVDELWGGRPPPTAAKNVQVYVSHLRKALGAEALQTTPPGYTLRVAEDALDAERLERLLADASNRAAAGRVEVLAEALALWRGPPLAEFADLEFARAEIARLEELRLQVLKRRLAADLELGRHEDVLVELERLVALHPLDEHLRGQLMLALYQSGRQADALAQFREARRVLRDELGLEPDEELRDLERRILAHDPDLRPSPLPAGARGPDAAPPRRLSRAQYAAVALVIAGILLAAVLVLPEDDSSAEIVVPANSVAVVDPGTGEVVASIPVGRGPQTVVAGAGAVWVANTAEHTLSRIDPRTLRVTKTVGLGFEPTDLAADLQHVWVAGGYDHVLWRVDRDGLPRLKLRFVERLGPLPESFARGPAGVALGPNSVWLSHGDEVSELDPATGEVRATVRAGGRWHAEIATDGRRVWVGVNRSSEPDPDTGLDRIETVGEGSVDRIRLLSDATEILAVDDRLFVANRFAGSVWELDPATSLVQRTYRAGNLPVGLVLLDDSLWVTTQIDAEARRLDVRSGETIEVVPIGHRLGDLAFAGGRLFVAVRGP